MLLYHLYLLSLPITLAACLYAYKSLDNNFKWFSGYLVFAVVYVTLDYFNLLLIKHTNASCNNLEGVFEFVFFTCFIASLDKRKSYKRKVYVFTGVVVLLSFIDMIFIQGFWKRFTMAMVLQDLFILSLICIYYKNLLEEAQEGLLLLKHPPFLAATGLLFYFLSNAVFYSCFSYMAYKNNYHFYILAYTIPGISNLLLNSLLIYAFLCFSKTKKLSL